MDSVKERKTGNISTSHRIGALILCVLLIVLTALSFASCSKQNKQKPSSENITVTDSVGRSVKVPQGSDHIAVLDSFTGEAMVMAGAGDQMVACPGGVSSDLILREIYPGLDSIPAAASSGAVNIETLAATGAEVVFVKESLYESGGETDKLDKLGIPYLVIGYKNMDEQIAALDLIGEVCGGEAGEKMDRITDYYEKTIETVSEHAKQIPEDQKIRVYHSINEIARTDGEESIGTDWIETTGAVNVSAGLKDPVEGRDYQASLEQIYEWDPDVVICNAADTTDYVYSDSKWQGLRAVREKNVKTIPVGATRWGQRGSVETYFAMLWLGCELYPEVYSDIDLKKEVTDFYGDLLGIEVSDELYESILSGRGVRKSGNNTGGGQKE